MNIIEQVKIRYALPERYRSQAARLYYGAFEQKLGALFGSQEHGIAILEKSFDPELAIVASWQNQLVGLIGLQYDNYCFVDLKPSSFAIEFGWLRGLYRFAHFLPLFQLPHKGELVLDGVAVHASMRGRGIGTRLLETACTFAWEGGFSTVSLEVVDTNLRARRLYERIGFVPLKTQRCALLTHKMGFSASTKMVRRIK